jgi:hypothetical protein
MERLNKVIEQYGRWSGLKTYTERIEAYVQSDFSFALENAKSLLETICKEICDSKDIKINANSNINQVLKKSLVAIGYTSSESVIQISSALATIGQQMGNLRNEIGRTSHGGTLEELRERNNKIDELTKELLIDTTDLIAMFLIRNFENENPRIKIDQTPQVLLTDNPEFNEFLDETYGDFFIGEYSYTASEIFFYTDYMAYLAELKLYLEGEK